MPTGLLPPLNSNPFRNGIPQRFTSKYAFGGSRRTIGPGLVSLSGSSYGEGSTVDSSVPISGFGGCICAARMDISRSDPGLSEDARVDSGIVCWGATNDSALGRRCDLLPSSSAGSVVHSSNAAAWEYIGDRVHHQLIGRDIVNSTRRFLATNLSVVTQVAPQAELPTDEAPPAFLQCGQMQSPAFHQAKSAESEVLAHYRAVQTDTNSNAWIRGKLASFVGGASASTRVLDVATGWRHVCFIQATRLRFSVFK